MKDNSHGYWFKAKPYGYGLVPARWQGWLVLFVFIGLAVLNFLRIDSKSHSVSDTLINFVPQTIILILLFIYICRKTGEKSRLQ